MDPLKVAAQFAAYVWFSANGEPGPEQEVAAVRFSKENWVAFLPAATEDRGTALIKLAAYREKVIRLRRLAAG